MRRRALDTSGLTDADRWENLLEQVLASPPPYRAAPGQPVYVIYAGDRAVLVAEQDLTGPLAELVETILETGGPPLATARLIWAREQGRPSSDRTTSSASRRLLTRTRGMALSQTASGRSVGWTGAGSVVEPIR